MNKSELIVAVAEETGLSKKASEAAVNAVLNNIIQNTAEGGGVQLIGFGTFTVAERAAREARNPQTGETVSVPATVVPKFKPGKAFKEAVR